MGGIPQTVKRSDGLEHWSKASSDEVTATLVSERAIYLKLLFD